MNASRLPPLDELPADVARRVDQACLRFEAAWQGPENAEPPRIEEYLGDASAEDYLVLLRELLAADLSFRLQRRETPAEQDYLRRFPDGAPAVRAAFAELGHESATFPLRPPRPEANGPPLPHVVGRYELLDVIGRGGMGVVYKARQLSTGRLVALKLIRPDRLLAATPEERKAWLQRFRAEGEAAALIEHDHIVTVYDVGEADGHVFYAMRYIAGHSLAEMVREHPLACRQAAGYLEPVARAVSHAHARGLIHRDLKPHNLLVDAAGRAWVADFGLAKWLDAPGDLTRTGQLLGTPSYMAPEQAGGAGAPSPAIDIYGLGATLYHLLTGRPPFQAAQLTETLRQVRDDEPVTPTHLNRSIDRDLETICLKCLRKSPADRYASAVELADDLRRYLDGVPIRARRPGWLERGYRWAKRRPAIAALLLVLLVAVTAGMTGVTVQWRRAEIAREELNQALYLSHIRAAYVEWLAGNVSAAEQLVNQCRPSPGGRDRRGWEWHYVRGLLTAQQRTLHTYKGSVYGVAFSPDGRYLVTAAADPYWTATPGEVKVWDADTETLVRELHGSRWPIRTLAVGPNGVVVAGGGRCEPGRHVGELLLWDASTDRPARPLIGHQQVVLCVAISPDGNVIVSGDAEGLVCVWHAPSGQLRAVLRKHTDKVRGVAVAADGQVFSTADDNRVLRWKGGVWHPFAQVEGAGLGLALNHDSSRLAVAANDILIFDVRRQQHLLTLRGHESEIKSVAFSPDDRLVVSCSAESVRIWDAMTGAEVESLRAPVGNAYRAAMHPDGRRVVSGSLDGLVRLWERRRPQQSLTLRYQEKDIGWNDQFPDALGFRADGRALRVHTVLGRVRTWDAEHGKLLSQRAVATFKTFHLPPWSPAAFDAGAARLAAIDRKDPTILRVWDAASAKELVACRGHSMSVSATVFSPNGTRLASAASDVGDKRFAGRAELKLWDAATGEHVQDLSDYQAALTCLAFSPDGLRLAGAASDGSVCVWDLRTRQALTIPAHDDLASSVAFSPDGRLLATAGYRDTIVRLWDVRSGRLLRELKGGRAITCLTFHPRGDRLAAVNMEVVQIWDVATGGEALTLRGRIRRWQPYLVHNARVAFSPDGHRLAATNWEHSISVWDGTPVEP